MYWTGCQTEPWKQYLLSLSPIWLGWSILVLLTGTIGPLSKSVMPRRNQLLRFTCRVTLMKAEWMSLNVTMSQFHIHHYLIKHSSKQCFLWPGVIPEIFWTQMIETWDWIEFKSGSKQWYPLVSFRQQPTHPPTHHPKKWMQNLNQGVLTFSCIAVNGGHLLCLVVNLYVFLYFLDQWPQ